MSNTNQQIADISKGKLRYLRPFIVLVPTLIICILNIVTNIPVLTAMWRLLIVIIIFFIFGTVAQKKIMNSIIASNLEMENREAEVEKSKSDDSDSDDDEDDEDEDETTTTEENDTDEE